MLISRSLVSCSVYEASVSFRLRSVYQMATLSRFVYVLFICQCLVSFTVLFTKWGGRFVNSCLRNDSLFTRRPGGEWCLRNGCLRNRLFTKRGPVFTKRGVYETDVYETAPCLRNGRCLRNIVSLAQTKRDVNETNTNELIFK